jgi:hypothetical protein
MTHRDRAGGQAAAGAAAGRSATDSPERRRFATISGIASPFLGRRTTYDFRLGEISGSMDHDNDDNIETLRQKLAALKSEHRDLDDVIAQIGETAPFDQIQIKRLKKRKLLLKDQIIRIESRLLPDIIA